MFPSHVEQQNTNYSGPSCRMRGEASEGTAAQTHRWLVLLLFCPNNLTLYFRDFETTRCVCLHKTTKLVLIVSFDKEKQKEYVYVKTMKFTCNCIMLYM